MTALEQLENEAIWKVEAVMRAQIARLPVESRLRATLVGCVRDLDDALGKPRLKEVGA